MKNEQRHLGRRWVCHFHSPFLSARSKDFKTPEDGKSPGVVGVPESLYEPHYQPGAH